MKKQVSDTVKRVLAILFFLASTLSPLNVAHAATPTYSGVDVATGSDQTWVTLIGTELSHISSRTSGYQTVYYRNASGGSWTPFSSGEVRNNPSDSETIQVFIPSGIQVFLFHIDVCDDWSAITGCVALEANSSTYTVTGTTVTLHFENGSSDSSTIYPLNTIFQFPRVSDTASNVFKEWNSQSNGGGTSYSPFTNITVNGKKDFYAQWISKAAPQISLYMDAPFVQASYATGSKVKTENFESHSTGATSCGDAGGIGKDFSVGVVTGTCQVATAQYASASTNASDPFVGGVGGNFATDYPNGPFKVQFDSNQKYVGFWWAAGSPGNSVEFLSGSNVVATINVNQLFGIFGDLPPDYAGATDSVQAINGDYYPKKHFLGNPSGYDSLTPVTPSSISPSEPYVYIHAFASNGAYFDGIRFSGANFEIDNLTISKGTVNVLPRLIYVQGIEAQNLDPNQEIYFVGYDSNTATTGSAPVDSISPYAPGDSASVIGNSGSLSKIGFTFAGWNTKSDGTGNGYLEGESMTVNSDINLYAKWVANTYRVQFNSQGGSIINDLTFQTGGNISLPGAPTYAGYNFNGWFETMTGGNSLTNPYSPIGTSDVTLYAQWSQSSQPTPPTPTVQQQNSITDTGTISVSGSGGDVINIPGNFPAPIIEIQIDSSPIPNGSWSQSPKNVSFTAPPHAPGPALVNVIDGQYPPLPPIQIIYAPSEIQKVVPLPPKEIINIPNLPSQSVIVVQPKKINAKPDRKVSVSRQKSTTVIKIAPVPLSSKPVIDVATSDIAIKGLNEGERIRVTIAEKNGESKVISAKGNTELNRIIKYNSKSNLKIEITPTLSPALTRSAQIAIAGAKKYQRVRVTVK